MQSRNASGKTKLFLAIEKDEVRALLEEAKKKNVARKLIEKSKVDNQGNEESPLSLSCFKQTEITKLLLEFKADLNRPTHDLRTPLQVASNDGNLSTVELLLDNNVDVDSHNMGHQNLVNWNTPLVLACNKGHIPVIKKLLEHKANIEATDQYTSPVLMIAVYKENHEVLKLLLTSDLKWNDKCLRGSDGKSMLHKAAEQNDHKMVEIILSSPEGKLLINDKQNNSNHTPLGSAIDNKGDLDMAKLLITNGADIRMKTGSRKKVPLKIAKEGRKQDIANFIKEWKKSNKGKDYSSSDSDSDGNTGSGLTC